MKAATLTLNRSKGACSACAQRFIGFETGQGIDLNGSTLTIPSHAWLARNTGCDHNKVGSLQRLLQAIALG